MSKILTGNSAAALSSTITIPVGESAPGAGDSTPAANYPGLVEALC